MSITSSNSADPSCDKMGFKSKKSYQRSGSFLVWGVLCLSLPMLGGCAAAGVAALFNSGSDDALGFANSTEIIPTPNASVSLPVYDNTGSVTLDATTGVVTSTSYAGTSTGSLVVNYDANAEPTSLVLTNVAGSFTFPADDMTTQTSVEGYNVLSGYSDDELASFSAIDYGEYLTFGIWSSSNASSTLAYGSGFYMGDVTPIASVPATGQATYRGRSIGWYASTTEGVYITGASFAGVVDFSSRTLGVATSGTTGSSIATGLSVSSPSLDWSGGGTLSGDGFSGTITQGNGVTGSFSGKFFGPSAEALGGSFGTSNAQAPHFGTFGGVK